MTPPTLERLRLPMTILAVGAALIVAFDVLVLLLNSLGVELSVLNQPRTVRRLGQTTRTPGLGLRGVPLILVNMALLLAHALLLWLALRARELPTRGRALVAALYALIPCNCACLLFPITIWTLVAMQDRARSTTRS